MDWNEVIRIFIIMWFSYLIVDSISKSVAKVFSNKVDKRKGEDENGRN